MGKSTISKQFRRLGFRVWDADAEVHNLYAPGGAAVEMVREALGDVVIDASGAVDRSAISKLIQESEDGGKSIFETLGMIVHPLTIQSRMDFVERAESDGEFLCVVDVPLLLEGVGSGGSIEEKRERAGVDAIVVVSCPPEQQRARCLARDEMNPEKLDAILARQLPDHEKRALADFVIDTGHVSLSAGRAQLFGVVEDLAREHADRFEQAVLGRTRCDRLAEPVQCLLFDLDDTVYPVLPALQGGFDAMREAAATHLPKTFASGELDDPKALGARMRALMSGDDWSAGGGSIVAHDLTQMRRAALTLAAREHGDIPALLPADGGSGGNDGGRSDDATFPAIEAVMDAFVRQRSTVDGFLYDDAMPCLRELKEQRRLVLGAVTNGNCDVLEHNGKLSSVFDFAVSAIDAGAAKPRWAPFMLAQTLSGIPLRATVVVGDSLKSDVGGGAALGMRTVLLDRSKAPAATAAISAGKGSAGRGQEVAGGAAGVAAGAANSGGGSGGSGGGGGIGQPTATIASLAQLPGILDLWAGGPGDPKTDEKAAL